MAAPGERLCLVVNLPLGILSDFAGMAGVLAIDGGADKALGWTKEKGYSLWLYPFSRICGLRLRSLGGKIVLNRHL